MIEVIGVPFARCCPDPGCFLGPQAIQSAGLDGIRGDVCCSTPFLLEYTPEPEPTEHATAEAPLRNAHEFIPMAIALKAAVGAAIGKGTEEDPTIPLVLGGDHSISTPSISAALDAYGDELVVLWIDAHADINAPATSDSGNLHGMPLGALIGRSESNDPVNQAIWERIGEEVVGENKLDPDRIAWIGLRSVDPGEGQQIMKSDQNFYKTMQDIDAEGMNSVIDAFESWYEHKGRPKIWISFDIDVVDPVLAPGTGTVVRGGLTYRESHYLAERLHEICRDTLVGLDLVEVNPLKDHANATAVIAVEWAASLFGKRILPRRG